MPCGIPHKVLGAGVEPANLTVLAPKASVSANSTTPALYTGLVCHFLPTSGRHHLPITTINSITKPCSKAGFCCFPGLAYYESTVGIILRKTLDKRAIINPIAA